MATDDNTDSDDNKDSKAKGGKAGGTGAIGATKAQLTQAFLTYMTSIGAPMEVITKILREHGHLKGEDLTKALAMFSKDIARISAHALVQFDGRDFALVNNLLHYMSSRDIALTASKLSYDEKLPGMR